MSCILLAQIKGAGLVKLYHCILVTADCRVLMKREFRKDHIDKFLLRRDEELRFLVDVMLQPQTQKKFELYFEALKRKN